jgi:hypothetical protein
MTTIIQRTDRRLAALALATAALALPAPAAAQLDPLLFLKTTNHNVLLAVDTSQRMQRDADEVYYDPRAYLRLGRNWEPTLGISAATTSQKYRRTYRDLVPTGGSGNQFVNATIGHVGDLQAGYSAFYARTRLGVARLGLQASVLKNASAVRFSLLKMRQNNVVLGTPSDLATGTGGTTDNSDFAQNAPTDTGNAGRWNLNLPTLAGANSAVATVTAPVVAADAANQNASVFTILGRDPETTGALLAASRDTSSQVDAPIDNLLDDARAEAVRLIAADVLCRNTVVVLVVGGGEGNASGENPAAKASTFLNISGRRVPIYVVAIAPKAAEVAGLRSIATNSGGQFFEITQTMIDRVPAGTPVPEVTAAVNLATQHTFVSQTTFNTAPTALLPFGPSEDFQTTSPITGSVNLEGARDINGVTLVNTVIENSTTGTPIPQRNNVTLTSGFTLPGFDAKLRAFRVYEPVADSTKPAGYRFDQDGTPLWVAHTPEADARNIYTVLPTGTVVSFDAANATVLAPYLRANDAAALIAAVRARPLGAIINSTPAILDPPSLDPPPDIDYTAFRDANKGRRSMVFVGGNDGMLHAIDGRLGVEAWAFIPFNLLPKLRLLESGQPVGDFNYFVDSSAKIADIKVGGVWRTYMFLGQGPGGTFYNTFDVTMGGMAASVSATSDTESAVLPYFASPSSISFVWSFPRNSAFDWNVGAVGDLGASATALERTVGETWSDPAIGQVEALSSPYVMFVGSGFLKYSWQLRPFRAGAVAGTTLYMLNAATGAVLASQDIASDGLAETVDDCRAVNNCTRLKNALQMDPVATGVLDSRFVSRIYVGDLDGRVWRFNVGLLSGAPVINGAPVRLYDATAAHPLFASMATVTIGPTAQYIFVGTGADLLPSNGVNQSYKLLVLQDVGAGTAALTAEILLEATDGTAGDEKVTAFPAVAGDIVFFTTTTQSPLTPCTPFVANLYAFTFTGGPAYDTNGDGRLTGATTTGSGKTKTTTAGDSTKVTTVAGARATAPFVVDQHLVFGAGSELQMFGDPQDFNNGVGQVGVRILSWREIR